MDTENLLPQKEAPPPYQPTAPPQQVQPSAPQNYSQGHAPQQPYYQYQEYQNQPPYQAPQQTIVTGLVWCLAFTSFFCCTLFGILALIFAFAAYDNEKRLEYEKARQSAKLAKLFAIVAILIGSLVTALMGIMFTVTFIVGA